MSSRLSNITERWSNSRVFILAGVGATFGLSKLWLFPFSLYEGGGVFILAYITGLFLFGFPLMYLEVSLGRRGSSNIIELFREHSTKARASHVWSLLGGVFLCIASLVFIFNGLLACVSLRYLGIFASDELAGLDYSAVVAQTQKIISEPLDLIWIYTFFLSAVLFLNGTGVRGGLQWVGTLVVPMIFIFILGFFIHGYFTGLVTEEIFQLLSVDFSKFSFSLLADAFTYAFFSMCLARGTMIVYGSYLDRNALLLPSILTIGVLDFAVVLLSSMVVLSLVLPWAIGKLRGGKRNDLS